MKKLNFLISSIVLIFFITSCKKREVVSEQNPPTSKTPVIELVSALPTTVQQLNDSIVFTIHYTDGDGDLGFENADSSSVFITDNRFPLDFFFHLQPLAPLTSEIAITGNLPIVFPNTILENNSNSTEAATFSIKLKDRAGNWSNTVTTGTITVTQ